MADLTSAQLEAAGKAARAALLYALRTRDRFPGVVRLPVRAVCRTAGSDLAASRTALDPLITRDHLKAHGFEDLWFLADDVPPLANVMPDLVGRLYVYAFDYDEDAGDPTPIGSSRILGLRSTRRQDYHTGLFRLGERFEAFLRIAPEEAVRGLDAALRASARTWNYKSVNPSKFTIAGIEVWLRDDHGRYWDDERISPDAQGQMLRALDTVADGLAGRKEKEGRLALIYACASHGRSSSLWSRLVRIGTRHPTTWGRDLAELATQPTLLVSWSTTEAVGRYIVAVFPSLNAATRTMIERTLTGLSRRVDGEDADRARAIANRILMGVDPVRLRTVAARLQLADALAATHELAANRPIPALDESELADSFGDIEADSANAEADVRDAVRPIGAEGATTSPELRLTQLEELLDLLMSSVGEISSKTADQRWADLATSAITLVERHDDATVDELDRLEVLIRAAVGHRLPLPSPGPFDALRDLSWSPLDVRTNATIALMGLVWAGRTYPEVALLAADPVPAVRFQVISRLGFLMTPDRALAIRIARAAATDEQTRIVILGLLHSLTFMLHVVPSEATEMLETLLGRFPHDHDSEGVRASSARLLATLSVSLNQDRATEIIDAFRDDPPAHLEEIEAVIGALRSNLTIGPVPGTAAEAERRRRSLERMSGFVRAAHSRMDEVAARPVIVPEMPWPEDESIEWQKCVRVANAVAQEVYFGSLAYDANQKPAGESNPSADRLARFYSEGRFLLEDLATIGWPQVTHHLIQTLRALVWVDPLGVLELAVQAIASGRAGGYEYESLAVAEVVALVEDYLTNHRGELLANDDAVGQLVEILDGFVRLGWEPAVRLTYRLGDIYR